LTNKNLVSQQKVNIKKLKADIWLKKIFGDPRNFGGSDPMNELIT